MQIGNQYGVAYQPQPSKKSGVNQPIAANPPTVNPTSVRTETAALNLTSQQPLNQQSNQQHQSSPDYSQRQSPDADFDFELAASSGVNNQTVYDKPTGANRFAIDSYRQVVNGPKREEIQRLVGIDTFA